MNLVADANILFAALIKEGKTIEILLNSLFNFYAPEFLFEEFKKYREEILHKTYRNKENFLEIFDFPFFSNAFFFVNFSLILCRCLLFDQLTFKILYFPLDLHFKYYFCF